MSDVQLPTLRASLFKDTSERRVDYSGSATIKREDAMLLMDYLLSDRAESDDYGLKLYISGWKKTSSGGKDYLSLSIQPPMRAYQEAAPAPAPLTPPDDDGIPF